MIFKPFFACVWSLKSESTIEVHGCELLLVFVKVLCRHKEASQAHGEKQQSHQKRGGEGWCVPALCIQLVRRSAAVARHTHYGFSRKQDAFGAIRYVLRTRMRMDR